MIDTPDMRADEPIVIESGELPIAIEPPPSDNHSEKHSAPYAIERARLITFVCYMALMMLGIAGTLLGPALPAMAARFAFPLDLAGIIPAVQAIGVFLGVGVSGWLADRMNARTILIIGGVSLALGLGAFGLAGNLLVALITVAISGFGFGMLNVMPNVIIAMLYPANASAALSTLNVFFGIGAILGPQIASFALAHGDYTLTYRITPIISLLLTALILTIRLPDPDRSHAASAESATKSAIPWRIVLPFALIAFLYVSLEAGSSSWIAIQLEHAAAVNIADGALATSLLWAGITTGRFVAGLILHRIRDSQFLLSGVTLIVLSAAGLILFGHTAPIGFLGAYLLGLGCSATFPITLAKALLASPQARGAVSGLLLAVASLGATFGPWVQGLISTPRDGGIIYTLVAGLILLGVVLWSNRRERLRR